MRHLFFSAVIALGLLIAGPALADLERSSDTPQPWWWLHGVTIQQVTDHINANNARLIDLEVESTLPFLVSAAFVENTGEMNTAWWWYVGQSVASLSNLISQNNARIIDLVRYSGSGGTQYAAIMVRNTGSYAKTWWWYVGRTQAQVSSLLTTNNARLVDMESYVVGSTRYYDVVMIRNAGADAASWWWWTNVTESFLSSQISSTGARIIDLDTYKVGTSRRFDAVLKSNPQGTNWWWYYGKSSTDVTDLINQNGSRIVDIETYMDTSGQFLVKRFAVAMINNSNELTTEMGGRLGYGSNGTTGAYLKKVGSSSTLASLNADFAFEPASTMKIAHNFYAMRQIMFGGDSLDNSVTFSRNLDGSCPIGGAPFVTQTLSETLEDMMMFSDNSATEGIAQRYGAANIESVAKTVGGMPTAELNHTLGCGPPNGQASLSNRLTLREVGGLFEGVQNGTLLTSTYRDLFYQHMQSDSTPTQDQWWFTTDLRDVVFQEAASLGIPGAAQSFWASVALAWKPGGYSLCWPNCLEYRSVAGIVTLPTCGRALTFDSYAFGLYIDRATGVSSADSRLRETKELFRDLVRNALSSCPTAAPDISTVASSVSLRPSYPNPFNPSTTLRFEMKNAGRVLLQIYDLRGQHVATLVDEHRGAGAHETSWHGTDARGKYVASGTYMVRAMTADGHDTQKIVLAK